jgi:dipeptidase E
MRLYLSSYKFGNYIEEFVKLVDEKKRVAVIMNAVDWGDPARVAMNLTAQIEKFKSLGLEAEQLDLRKYFGRSEELKKHLESFGAVWVYGGNTFVLKRAYEQSGLGEIIKKMLAEDKIVYAGFSAGVVILSKSLKGLDIVDDPKLCQRDIMRNLTGMDWVFWITTLRCITSPTTLNPPLLKKKLNIAKRIIFRMKP